MDKYRVLKQYFGYDAFRPGQEGIIDAILSGRDAFGIMPTGGGKSICYQIPALMLPGVTFVVSPLISLMTDQVMQLKQAGVPAAYINSTLTASQLNTVYKKLRSGMYKIIYVAPERLETEEFRSSAEKLDISLFAVDEAHCISQWGQDFRPCYLKIPEFIDALKKRPVISAFTATATERVRQDIEKLLGLCNPQKVITSFDRPNLFLDVLKPKNKYKTVLSLVNERKGKSGIIYCSTRSKVESVCEKLCEEGISATRYHAGLEDLERNANQEDFLYDKKSVMVATNAFGMGINKSNVNYVIHYNMPKSLEEYYQEAGRAGRDGENADCILLYGASDIITAKLLIAKGAKIHESEFYKLYPKEAERLNAMIDYCDKCGCYRGKILDYFGESHSEFCENCGECKSEYDNRDVTVEAQKILSCIERIYRKNGFYLGKTLVIAALRGKSSEKLLRYGLDNLSVYGIMKNDSKEYIEKIFDYLCSERYIDINDEYKTARSTSKSLLILSGSEKLIMPFKRQNEAEKTDSASEKIKKRKASSKEIEQSADLFEVLRKLRLEIAAEEKQPPFVIFHDSTLRDMAAKRPKNREEFLEVSGIGEKKAEKHGEAFLRAIARYNEENSQYDPEYNNIEKPEQKSLTMEEKEQKKREAALAMDDEVLGAVQKADSKQNKPDIKENPTDLQKDHKSGFEALLREAKIALSEHPSVNENGIPAKVTVLLTSNGSIYTAVYTDKQGGLSSTETKLLTQMSRQYDTSVRRLVTMWHDGGVFGTSPALFKRLYELDRTNRNTDILVAKNTRKSYSGEFRPDDYNVTKLKNYL